MSATQQKALTSLQAKSQDIKILPADKGNATVIMTNELYHQKMLEHLESETYSILKKDPTESLSRKLDAILKNCSKKKGYRNCFMMIIESCIRDRRRFMAYQKFISPGTHCVPLSLFTTLRCRHSTSSFLIY